MSGNDEEVTKAEGEEESDQSLVKAEADEYDVSVILKSECAQESEETIADSSVTIAKPKILVQRVFQQTENHVVEQKLDYVIANSEEEITKHIFGGLFRTKYYNYAPENYCKKHDPDLFEHQDETLVKLGDKFDSRESFRLYVDGYAKQWKYYLKCADSHRKGGKETFVFNCVFAKQRYKYSAAGLRKRTLAVPRFACPCRIILKPVPFGAKDLTVIYVCNHHDHPLTDEYFQKLQHGRRLHPSVRAELMDLLSLEVDREVVKKYFESLTGYTMNDGFFNNTLTSMKKNKVERQFSLEKLKEMSKKVEKIKEELGMNDEENVDNDIIPEENIRKDKASQVAEVFNVLKAVSAPKRTPQKLRARRNNPESGPTPGRKRQRKQQDVFDDPPLPSPEPVNNQSRLETRLQELKHDQETLQSVKHLQDSVRCQTEHNPWVIDNFAETPNRPLIESKPKRGRNSYKHPPVTKPEIEPQTIVIENPTHEENYVENQEIVYENEITIMETGVENNPDSIVECVNVVNPQDIELNENNVSYCIQYEEDEQGAVAQSAEQQYVLLLDDVESFENLPEVQIQATELATVSIVSENNQEDTTSEVTNANEQDCNTAVVETTCQNDDIKHDAPEVPIMFADNICVVNNSNCDVPKNTEEVTLVYEVIQTNDKKIWPNKQLVDTVILNKVPKSKAPKSESINMSLKSKDKSGVSKKKVKQIIKDVTEEYMKDVFKEDLDKLAEDECFMIVVNDQERNGDGDNSSQDWMEDFDDYEIPPRHKRAKYNDEVLHEYDSAKSDGGNNELESIENKNELDSNKQERDSSTKPYEYWLEELEDSKDSSYSTNRREREIELFELQEAVSELKRQKVVLERDIRRLVATKDNLIEDITKTKAKTRLATRAFKWKVPR